jgi:hypothetical protein
MNSPGAPVESLHIPLLPTRPEGVPAPLKIRSSIENTPLSPFQPKRGPWAAQGPPKLFIHKNQTPQPEGKSDCGDFILIYNKQIMNNPSFNSADYTSSERSVS